ncbi:leucine-rich repeats and immunoglobulin-like domains protein 1 [Xyrauchen texanus]|uniref:leucine-rich repeats and immunoglobulin-like domains protein 1 n=1 Tax=Xyrauchen texanus TaxID=154827 RepID=UPI002241EA0C|nr:leucine-rich repeats and immunoglobulin-like domains protein 1 [Xyrauchen texanus]
MMPGHYINLWLSLFAVFAREMLGVTVKTGLYSRVELTGEKIDQQTADSLQSVEWTKINRSSQCLCLMFKKNNDTKFYSQCCRQAHFYLNNNSLILENVTVQDEGVYMESIVSENRIKKSPNITLYIQNPTSVSEIMVSWISNTSVTLRCEVTGLFLHLKWMKEGVSILDDYRHSISERNQTLHITNITSSDYGTYSCLVTNSYGVSEKQTHITGENRTLSQENSTSAVSVRPNNQIVLSIGLTLIGVLGLCIVLIVIYKYHHDVSGDCHRKTLDRMTRGNGGENGRTAEEGDEDIDLGIFQEIHDIEEVTPLPYVYTDFIKPREPNQASASAEHFEEFGYSEIGPVGREDTVLSDCAIYDEQARLPPDALKE